LAERDVTSPECCQMRYHNPLYSDGMLQHLVLLLVNSGVYQKDGLPVFLRNEDLSVWHRRPSDGEDQGRRDQGRDRAARRNARRHRR
jgi:hypothetical protein